MLMICKIGFGLPPTPPSSLSSDDSEDNQSAEMHTIPSSPASSMSSFSPNSSQSQSKNNSQSVSNGSPNSARGFNSSSSRQPIHTPLISTQPVCVFVLFPSNFNKHALISSRGEHFTYHCILIVIIQMKMNLYE